MPLLDKVWMNKPAWFRAVAAAEVVYLERCENYQKQSWRNRARIATADGPLVLSLPICKSEGGPLPIARAEIELTKPWLQQHERAIVSAYRTSAYFEYYQDELFEILESRPERLFDLNMALIRFFIEKTGIKVDLRVTDDFSRDAVLVSSDGQQIACDDLREKIHPKRPNDILHDLELEKPYFQVFSQKYGFQPDLSIMDLLFNEGPDSILYLKKL